MTKTQLRHIVHHPAYTVVMIALQAAALVIAIVALIQVQDQNGCLAAWGGKFTDRSNRLTQVQADKNTAQDTVINALNVALGDAIAQNRAKLAVDVPKYQQAVREYNTASASAARAAQQNPVPAAPSLHCG